MKCSNLLFDKETNQPVAVIDWDTIMSGMPVYDFGDAVRSFASNVSSSERNLKLVQGNLYFKTEFPEQNLIRAKNQIKLAEEILKHESEMENFL